MPSRREILSLGAGALALTLAPPRQALAQQYPDRVVRVVVPSAAGAPDTVARIFALQLQSQLNQSFVVENRPAANGTVATDAVTKAAPDGYTLLVTSTAVVVNPSIYRNLSYDVLMDLEPVTSLCRSDGYVLVVNSSLAVRSLRELIALGRDANSALFYGSPGVGNALHLAAEMFKVRTGIRMTHVPYRGTGPAITDLLGGRIQVMFVTSTLSLEHIRAGTLRPLAYTSKTRRPVLPDVPTMAEAGVRKSRHGRRLVRPFRARENACGRRDALEIRASRPRSPLPRCKAIWPSLGSILLAARHRSSRVSSGTKSGTMPS